DLALNHVVSRGALDRATPAAKTPAAGFGTERESANQITAPSLEFGHIIIVHPHTDVPPIVGEARRLQARRQGHRHNLTRSRINPDNTAVLGNGPDIDPIIYQFYRTAIGGIAH